MHQNKSLPLFTMLPPFYDTPLFKDVNLFTGATLKGVTGRTHDLAAFGIPNSSTFKTFIF